MPSQKRGQRQWGMYLSKREMSKIGRRGRLSSLQMLLTKKKLRWPLPLSEDHILSLIYARRARNVVFGGELFSDPAWDILLELYAAYLGKRTILLPELARVTEVPLSTTRRWLAVLGEHGLVSVTSNLSDPDLVKVELTQDGSLKVERLVGHWGSAFMSI